MVTSLYICQNQLILWPYDRLTIYLTIRLSDHLTACPTIWLYLTPLLTLSKLQTYGLVCCGLYFSKYPWLQESSIFLCRSVGRSIKKFVVSTIIKNPCPPPQDGLFKKIFVKIFSFLLSMYYMTMPPKSWTHLPIERWQQKSIKVFFTDSVEFWHLRISTSLGKWLLMGKFGTFATCNDQLHMKHCEIATSRDLITFLAECLCHPLSSTWLSIIIIYINSLA